MKQKELFGSLTLIWVWFILGYVENEILCCIFNAVGLTFCQRSWTSCSDTWHHGFNQIPTD